MKAISDSVPKELSLPSRETLSDRLRELVGKSDAAKRCYKAVVGGLFEHPDGDSESLGDIRLAPMQLALLSYLAPLCPTKLSIEVGYGMGSSATMILAARTLAQAEVEHIVYDPYGLGGPRGQVVERFLLETFGGAFKRVWEKSEIGLPELLSERGREVAGLAFIDGYHTFEQVMVDFFMADQLCAVGGFIVFDDAHFPAIEAVVEYVRTNRPDYAVAHLPVVNTSVIQKVAPGRPAWDAYVPFKVPDRMGWMASTPEWVGELAPAE